MGSMLEYVYIDTSYTSLCILYIPKNVEKCQITRRMRPHVLETLPSVPSCAVYAPTLLLYAFFRVVTPLLIHVFLCPSLCSLPWEFPASTHLWRVCASRRRPPPPPSPAAQTGHATPRFTPPPPPSFSSLLPLQEDLIAGEDIARCPSCSLIITVIYDPAEIEALHQSTLGNHKDHDSAEPVTVA